MVAIAKKATSQKGPISVFRCEGSNDGWTRRPSLSHSNEPLLVYQMQFIEQSELTNIS